MYEEYQKGIPAYWVLLSLYVAGLAAAIICAGTLESPWLWIFVGIHGALFTVYSLMLKAGRPHVFRRNWSTDIEKGHVWRCLLGACVMALASVVISALDVYRFAWSPMPAFASVLGACLAMAGYMLAMQSLLASPPHAQEHYGEPKPSPENYGAYGVIRHPLALASILLGLSVPLMIGSLVGMIPVGIMIVLLVIYVNAEDNWRFAHYEWYYDYMKSVGYRLIPMIW